MKAPMNQFRLLTGDLDWRHSGATWYRRVRPSCRVSGKEPFGNYHLIRFALLQPSGMLPRYVAQLKRYDFDSDHLRLDDVIGALESCGSLDEDNQLKPECFARVTDTVVYLPALSGRPPVRMGHVVLPQTEEDKLDRAALQYLYQHFPLIVLDALNRCGYEKLLDSYEGNNARELLALARDASRIWESR